MQENPSHMSTAPHTHSDVCVRICMAMERASHPRIQNAFLNSLENGIKIYVAQRKLAVAAHKSNELHPAWYKKTSHHVQHTHLCVES